MTFRAMIIIAKCIVFLVYLITIPITFIVDGVRGIVETWKMFIESICYKKSETYARLIKDINKYAKENDLYIKSVYYDRMNDTIIANVLFSNIPEEIFVL